MTDNIVVPTDHGNVKMRILSREELAHIIPLNREITTDEVAQIVSQASEQPELTKEDVLQMDMATAYKLAKHATPDPGVEL